MSTRAEWKKELLEKLLPTLICVKCKTPPRPQGPGRQRHVCTQCGKAICGLCFNWPNNTVQACNRVYGNRKVCSGVFYTSYCEIVESTLKELPFACKNLPRGCQEIRSKEELEHHEKDCAVRLVNCVDSECGDKVPFNEFFKHIESHHFETSKVEKEVFRKNISAASKGRCSYYWKTIDHSKKFGHPFFEVNRLEYDLFYAWIYYLGSPEEAQNFEYTYSLRNYANPREKIIYRGIVRSVDECKAEIMKKEECLMIGREKLFRFGRKQCFSAQAGELPYVVRIRNLKEEAKDKNEDSGVSGDDDC